MVVSQTHRCGLALARQHRRQGGLVCLLALLLAFMLPIVHSWDHPGEVTSAVRRGGLTMFGLPLASEGRVRPPHDPALCTVCQLLFQSRLGLLRQATGLPLPLQSVAQAAAHAPGHARPYSTLTGPRAPPDTV